jgi:acylphosphatase
MAKIRVHIFVSGRVQGVFFRQSTQLQAQSLSVYGWIRNLQDGQVDGVFEGEESAVKSLVDYCRHGPLAARVENVGVKPEKYKAEFSTFEVF